jgi:hypothetical protein
LKPGLSTITRHGLLPYATESKRQSRKEPAIKGHRGAPADHAKLLALNSQLQQSNAALQQSHSALQKHNSEFQPQNSNLNRPQTPSASCTRKDEPVGAAVLRLGAHAREQGQHAHGAVQAHRRPEQLYLVTSKGGRSFGFKNDRDR